MLNLSLAFVDDRGPVLEDRGHCVLLIFPVVVFSYRHWNQCGLETSPSNAEKSIDLIEGGRESSALVEQYLFGLAENIQALHEARD